MCRFWSEIEKSRRKLNISQISRSFFFQTTSSYITICWQQVLSDAPAAEFRTAPAQCVTPALTGPVRLSGGAGGDFLPRQQDRKDTRQTVADGISPTAFPRRHLGETINGVQLRTGGFTQAANYGTGPVTGHRYVNKINGTCRWFRLLSWHPTHWGLLRNASPNKRNK